MKPSLIVSFTSYPARIYAVLQVLESLYAQSMKPDRILLWLAEEQFPGREADLPKELIDDAAAGKFELRWCDDLGSHKKYFYAMQEFPDDIVIIVDDDQYYHSDTIKTLYESYLHYPLAVSALKTTLILFDDEGEPLPYHLWPSHFISLVNNPTMQLVAIGIGGVLYPPHRLDVRVFDKDALQKLCTSDGIVSGDDIWLKMHAALCGTPVVLASKDILYQEIPDTQTSALRIIKPISFKTELCNAIRKHYEKNGDDILLRCLQQAMKEPTYQETQEAIEALPLGKRLWFCAAGDLKKDSLPQTQYDFNRLSQHINFRLAICNQRMACGYMDEVYDYMKTLQKMLHLTLEIQMWSERSEEVEIRAICDYGAVLRTYLWGDFRQAKNYLQMAQNWREFFAAHPHCDKRYFDGYEHFVKDMDGAIAEMERNGASAEELAECRSVLEADSVLWHRPEPKWLRLKKWVCNSRYGHVLSKVKRKVIRLNNTNNNKIKNV